MFLFDFFYFVAESRVTHDEHIIRSRHFVFLPKNFLLSLNKLLSRAAIVT